MLIITHEHLVEMQKRAFLIKMPNKIEEDDEIDEPKKRWRPHLRSSARRHLGLALAGLLGLPLAGLIGLMAAVGPDRAMSLMGETMIAIRASFGPEIRERPPAYVHLPDLLVNGSGPSGPVVIKARIVLKTPALMVSRVEAAEPLIMDMMLEFFRELGAAIPMAAPGFTGCALNPCAGSICYWVMRSSSRC